MLERGQRPGGAARWGLRTTAAGALLALASACGGGGGGAPAPVEPSDPVLVEAEIGPAGGSLAVVDGTGAEVALRVPPGAVAGTTRFRIVRDERHPEVPSLFPVYRFEPAGVTFAAAVDVAVPAGAALFLAGTPALTLFGSSEEDPRWLPVTGSALDANEGVVRASVFALGDFVAWDGNLHRLFTQEVKLQDPGAPTPAETLAGVEVLVANGSYTRQVGAGSLAAFWNMPAGENVIVLHGVLNAPTDFLGPEDLVANLELIRDNVVLFQYPSARGVAWAANRLYDLIQARRKPGFGCSLVGHSMGGLVARYLIERSHQDPARPGYQAGDPPLTDVVDRVVLLAVPNEGAAVSVAPFAPFAALLAPEERPLLQAVEDLGEAPGSLPFSLNDAYQDGPPLYHIVYGDLGGGNDGVVTVASALALPLGPGETATVFAAQHDQLHLQATSLGVAVQIGNLLQGQ